MSSLITEHDRIIGKIIEWKCVSAIVEQAGGEPKTLQYIFFSNELSLYRKSLGQTLTHCSVLSRRVCFLHTAERLLSGQSQLSFVL